MYALAEWTATYGYFMLATLTVAMNEGGIQISLFVFVPLRCPRGQRFYYNETVTAAVAAANANMTADDDIVFAARVFDSCFEEENFITLVSVLDQSVQRTDVVIGPGNSALCEPFARLLSLHNEALVSWDCTASALNDRATYRTLMRTVPNTEEAVRAMSTTLTHFRLHYVTVVFSKAESFGASDLHMQLSDDAFAITGFHRLVAGDFRPTLTAKMRAVDPRTKGESLDW